VGDCGAPDSNGVLLGVGVGVLFGVLVEVLLGVLVGVLLGVLIGVLLGVLVGYSCAALRNDLVYLDGPARGPKRWMMIAPRTKETCLNTIRELKKRVCLSNDE